MVQFAARRAALAQAVLAGALAGQIALVGAAVPAANQGSLSVAGYVSGNAAWSANIAATARALAIAVLLANLAVLAGRADQAATVNAGFVLVLDSVGAGGDWQIKTLAVGAAKKAKTFFPAAAVCLALPDREAVGVALARAWDANLARNCLGEFYQSHSSFHYQGADHPPGVGVDEGVIRNAIYQNSINYQCPANRNLICLNPGYSLNTSGFTRRLNSYDSIKPRRGSFDTQFIRRVSRNPDLFNC